MLLTLSLHLLVPSIVASLVLCHSVVPMENFRRSLARFHLQRPAQSQAVHRSVNEELQAMEDQTHRDGNEVAIGEGLVTVVVFET